jgi:hypothetical protein
MNKIHQYKGYYVFVKYRIKIDAALLNASLESLLNCALSVSADLMIRVMLANGSSNDSDVEAGPGLPPDSAMMKFL